MGCRSSAGCPACTAASAQRPAPAFRPAARRWARTFSMRTATAAESRGLSARAHPASARTATARSPHQRVRRIDGRLPAVSRPEQGYVGPNSGAERPGSSPTARRFLDVERMWIWHTVPRQRGRRYGKKHGIAPESAQPVVTCAPRMSKRLIVVVIPMLVLVTGQETLGGGD